MIYVKTESNLNLYELNFKNNRGVKHIEIEDVDKLKLEYIKLINL